mmetsp:Transcript_13782/g.22820  ORF Transcript_13782/g.22820 Transcript_13782/m.22820 type:complete len:736 (+) Transcript_13782:43-2250(+)|eukprot:CAMPEP_0119009114 /NCGR_PEP_ID=MMETSP1176-20130426/4153_1 /TAXON_ID=265551 /ORGANISM="Synedropsis recta cf, Strain CCMP1620" /LENGTH=735 /DNA_ID=CAMNT_0006961567 /DNA_START=24 /DNA_END=2231 /DNA_ORIENTATION=+
MTLYLQQNKKGRSRKIPLLLSLLLVSTAITSVQGKDGELRGSLNQRSSYHAPNTVGWDEAVKDPPEALSEKIQIEEYIDEPNVEVLPASKVFVSPLSGGMAVKNPSEKIHDEEYIEEPNVEVSPAKAFAAPTSDVIKKFMAEHNLKEGEDLPMQQITSSNTFQADGKMFSLNDLMPVDVFTADATYWEDGEPMTLPAASTFVKENGDDTVVVTKGGSKDGMRSIDIVHSDGSVTYMEEVSDGVVATVLPETRDRDSLQKFVMGHMDVDDDGEIEDDGDDDHDAEGGHEWRKLSKEYDFTVEHKGENGRMLQAGCSAFRIIDVAIAYESSFCSAMGGSENANAAVQQIVSRASVVYQRNLCTKIQISHMEGFCTAASDPYREGVMLNNSGCSGGGLLGFFSNFWSVRRESIRRDAAHLFSGTGLECANDRCVIGCASARSLCQSSRSYGVNFITFNRDGQMQSNLFAHELGHNAGSTHDPTTSSFEFIMEPTINGGANGFSQPSRNSISSFLDSRSCISVEQANPTAPTPPAPAPPAPTLSPPSSAPCGCTSCTASVLTSVINGFRCIDIINFVIATQGMSQLGACTFASDQFSSICGQECDPNQCGSGDASGGRGTIRSRFDSTCMDVNVANSNVRASDCNGGTDQDWIYDASTQRIMTAFNSDYCLDWNIADNNLYVFPCHSGRNQKWTWDGSRIKSLLNQNACIDLNVGSTHFSLNSCHSGFDQQFAVPVQFF